MAGIDLPSIIRDLGTLSQVQEQQTQQIAQTRFSQGATGEAMAENLHEVAERTNRVQTQQLGAQLEAQNQSRRVARAAGMDASANNEIISGIMGRRRTDMLAYEAASRHAQEIEANGNLLANPLGWLNAILNGDEANAIRDRTAERLAKTGQQLNNQHALTQANVQTQNAIAETMTESTIKDTAEANRLLAENKALQAEQQSREYTVAGIQTLRDYGSTEFNRRLQVGNQVRAEARAAASLEMQKKNHALRLKELEMREEGIEQWDYLAGAGNAAIKSLGIKRRDLTPAMVERHYGQNTPLGMEITTLIDRGLTIQDTGSQFLGSTPYDALSVANMFEVGLPATLDPTAVEAIQHAQTVLAQQQDEAAKFSNDVTATEGGLTRKNYNDPEVVSRLFNGAADSYLQQNDGNFDQFSINTQAIEQEYPQFQQTEFYKGVVEPLAATDAGITIQDAASVTAEKFTSGEIDINTATDGLQALWQAQKDLFAATNGRDAVGLATYAVNTEPKLLVGEKSTYRGPGGAVVTQATADRYGMSKDLKTRQIIERVDLTDPTAITRYLINYRSNKLARLMQENAGASSETGGRGFGRTVVDGLNSVLPSKDSVANAFGVTPRGE